LILKPVGILIEQGDIWDFNKAKNREGPLGSTDARLGQQHSRGGTVLGGGGYKSTPDEAQKGAGKMIGYLERIIVFFLLINGQYGAIAFVIAAKSVMRFPEIRESDDASSLAEFYIIGTLLSIASVLVVTFLLGL